MHKPRPKPLAALEIRIKEATDVILLLSEKNKAYTFSELFPTGASHWKRKLIIHLRDIGCVEQIGDRRTTKYMGLDKINEINSEDEIRGFLIEPRPTQINTRQININQEPQISVSEIMVLIEKFPRFLEIMEYQAQRIDTVTKLLEKIDNKLDAIKSVTGPWEQV